MISKRSFSVDIKNNLGRRIWVAVIEFLALFFAMPVLTSLILSAEKQGLSQDRIADVLGEILQDYVRINGFMGFLVAMLAILAAIQGFSYMYSRQKLDMYMAVPVSSSRRFWTIYINGILVFAAAFAVNIILMLLSAALQGADLRGGLMELPISAAGYLILYFSTYSMSILVAMITGHIIVTLLGTIVFLLYDLMGLLLSIAYMDEFFKSFSYRTSEIFMGYIISPLARFIYSTRLVYTVHPENRDLWDFNPKVYAVNMAIVFAAGLIYLLLAYLAYRKKPAEACGKAIAFRWLRPVIKIGMALQIGLWMGMAFYAAGGESTITALIGLVLGLLLNHGVCESIYDFDLRSVRKGLKTLGLSAALVFVIYGIFVFDIMGYDSYVPAKDRVDSIAISFNDGMTEDYYDGSFSYSNQESYMESNMYITEVEPVLELARRRMGIRGQDMAVSESELKAYIMEKTGRDGYNGIYQEVLDNVDKREETVDIGRILPNRFVSILYRMKDGRRIYRNFSALCLEDADLIEAIMSQEAYKSGRYTIYNDRLIEGLKASEPELYYDSGWDELPLDEMDIDELVAAYREDLKGLSFQELMEECPIGRIRIYGRDVSYRGINASLDVYPSCEKTMDCLRKKGLSPAAGCDTDAVEYIYISCNYNDFFRKGPLGGEISGDGAGLKVTDRQQIERLMGIICPMDFQDLFAGDYMLDYDFNVTIRYRDGALKGKGQGYESYGLLKKW